MWIITRFKKCGVQGCDGHAKKWIAVVTPDTEDKLGGWEYNKRMISAGFYKIDKIPKKEKYMVCSLCYDTLEPEDFEFKDRKSGVVHSTVKILRLQR